MTAPSSIDPAQFLHEHLSNASPDLLRSMLTTFMALMGAVRELAAAEASAAAKPAAELTPLCLLDPGPRSVQRHGDLDTLQRPSPTGAGLRGRRSSDRGRRTARGCA